MARTTVANTIERVRRRLSSGQRLELGILDGALTDSGTTVTFEDDLPANLRAGAIICIDLETMRVRSVDTAAKTATVVRGWQDSDAAAHSDDAQIWINPRFQPIDIFDAIQAELLGWGPELYKVLGYTATLADADDTYELPATMADTYGIIDVLRQWDDLGQYIEPVTQWPRMNWRLQRGTTAWTGITTSGIQLRFIDRTYAGSIFILAALPFSTTSMTTATDLVSGTGLQESMLDVLELGVIIRLVNDSEHARGARTTQDEPRRTEETPWGGGMNSMQVNLSLYQRRIQAEVAKLRAKYPIKVG